MREAAQAFDCKTFMWLLLEESGPEEIMNTNLIPVDGDGGRNNQLHFVPESDNLNHTPSEKCVCGPEFRGIDANCRSVYVHREIKKNTNAGGGA